jgi:ribonuclease HIII
MSPVLANIETKLRQWRAANASNEPATARDIANGIYKIIFGGETYATLWDERVLLGLEPLLAAHPPDQVVYGEQAKAIRERASKVRVINDLFYAVLDPETAENDAAAVFGKLAILSPGAEARLRLDGKIAEVRVSSKPACEKLQAVVDHVTSGEEGRSRLWLEELGACIQAIRERGAVGAVNALLIHKQANCGVLLTVTAGVQQGSGQVRAITPAAVTFVSAVERARLALVNKRFLPASYDVLLTVDLTEAEYSGGSIALGAAMAMYSSARRLCVDPYTAFTGDINFQDGDWVLQGVDGIAQKLQAALDSGCRRVFLPRDNESDVPAELRKRMKIVPVRGMTEVLVTLLLPLGGPRSDTLEAKKIYLLQATCVEKGWHLSGPDPIQDGVQFTLSPPNPPELKVNIYKTGSHSPIRSDRAEFQLVLDALASLDKPPIRARSVQQVFTIKDLDLRAQIRQALEKIAAPETKTEPYCDYLFGFEDGQEHLVVKQYTSGKLQVQGFSGSLYKQVLDIIVTSYNIRYPNAALNLDDYISAAPAETSSAEGQEAPSMEDVALPYIGTDESGKGDYFGPLVVAGVWLDEATREKLAVLGVRDSKTLSDDRCRQLAAKIRELCPGKCEEVEIPPERYNSLYEQFQREKKNLNHLLAWGHARALESLLARHPSKHALADQFGDETYIRSKLMEKGKAIQLVQTPKGERYMAVAAASVLARDRFLLRLEQMEKQVGVALPKGASPAVVDAARAVVRAGGAALLRKSAKMHFKTTSLVLGQVEGK